MKLPHRLLKDFDPAFRDLRILRDCPTPSVNIIAVHGLAAHPITTWIKKDEGWNWLEKQLVSLLPEARVWTFGYDSSWCGDFSVDTDLNEVASKLIDAIVANNLQSTRLVFIAHSFGGIVVVKSLIMAEDCDNKWSRQRKALSIFPNTSAILFFGTPFRGVHDWFQGELPRLARKVVSGVQDDVFGSFRIESPMLNELRRDFVNKCKAYKKPNVGFIFEMQDSKVGKIIGDDTIPMVRLVHRDSAILDGPETGESRFLNCGLERHHFNMHDFGENDTAFASVESLLTNLLALKRPALGSSALTLTRDEEKCLQSLFFSGMNDREYDVVNASKNTCDWLYENPTYIGWLNQQNGLLWIKGHPGVGKSTLMKHVLKSTSMMKEENTIVISFFFHGRGTSLQQNPLGLFQSLLHQLARQCSSVLRQINDVFSKKCKVQGEYGTKWEWHQTELQELLLSQVKEVAKTHTLRVYIDALDECGEEASIHLVDMFQEVAIASTICLSCRHYPLIAPKNGLEINVEANNANDVRIYVSNRLDEQKILAGIRDQIIEKASGNFQWVKIVTKLVTDWRKKGLSPKSIQQKIPSIPQELNQLYKDLLSGIDGSEKSDSLHLMQWICYALRPLSLTELRFAMAVDVDSTCQSISECQELEQYVATNEDMEKRVCHLSAGLAEVAWHNDRSTVQLIHQSVSDYFYKQEGFQLLGSSQDWAPAKTLSGHAHFRLSRSCIKYMSMREFLESTGWRSFAPGMRSPGILRARSSLQIEFPFLKYATWSWIPHAKIFEEQGGSQDDLVSYFQSRRLWQSWIDAYRFLYSWKRDSHFTNETTLLHVASKYQLMGVLEALHKPDYDINDPGGTWMTPLCLAAEEGHEAAVRWLLNWDNIETNAAKTNDVFFSPPLAFAVQFGREGVVKMLLERSDVIADFKDFDGQTPLSKAAEHGQEAMAKLLLERDDVNADTKDHEIRTPLSHAAQNGNEKVVKMLIKRDDVKADSKDRYGRTPLNYAAFYGHETVVKLLVERNDVAADSKDYRNRTPLIFAARNGFRKVVDLLMMRDDVNVNSRCSDGQTPLLDSIRYKREAVVKLLMERDDLKVNFKNRDTKTALHLTAAHEHESMANLLLNRHDIDVNSRDDHDNTPLHETASKGNKAVMKVILKHIDVNVNAKNDHGDTPLHVIARDGHEAAMRLLFERNDVDVNLKNKHGETPLQLAASEGSEAATKLLLERRDLNVTSRDFWERTALHWTSKRGFEASLELLLKRNDMDVNTRSCNDETPLHCAAEAGQEKTMTMLLEHKANPNSKDANGATSLHLTARREHEGPMSLLLKYNGDPNIKDNYGYTPLHRAARSDNETMIKLLSKQKVDLNVTDNYGDTPLHLTATKGHKESMKLLLGQKADANIRNTHGQTPLHAAILKGYEAMTKLLLEHKVDVNIKDDDGNTPLHWASHIGDENITRLLLNYNVDANIRRNSGDTPLDNALQKGHEAIVELLKPLTRTEESGQEGCSNKTVLMV